MTRNADVEKHVTFLANPALKGRVPGSDGSRIAMEYIIDAFREFGLKPLFDERRSLTQGIDVDGRVHGTNVGGIVEGERPGYVLVGAHYDHVSHSPGADDNAAAVAQLLAVAERLGRHPPEKGRGILFLAFDCEEPPNFCRQTMGSVFFAEHCPVPLDEIQVAIISDLTGHRIPYPGLEDCLFAIGTEYATAANDAVNEAGAGTRGIRVVCTSHDRVGDLSDHHAFRVHGRPFIFLSCGHGEHYHQPTDTVENLDLPKIAAIATFLENLVATCADGRDFYVDMCGHAFREKEAASLSRLLGKPIGVAEADGIIQSLRNKL